MSPRIAFFGSDAFSVASLSALLKLHRRNVIGNIDVITRSIKPTGRNRKILRDVPAGIFATENGLPVHRADCAADINALLGPYDLAVAVSYGRLIPAQFLARVTHGGVNLHPSLLPRHLGLLPIQRALMSDDKITGVTLQTLHPTKFDRGAILLRTSEMEIAQHDTCASLAARLSAAGSQLLVEAVEKRLYEEKVLISSPYGYSLAPKILPSDSEISWSSHTGRNIKRLHDALGPLHTFKLVDISSKKKSFRGLQKVILDDIDVHQGQIVRPFGTFFLDEPSKRLHISTVDGYISVGKLKFQYCGSEDAVTFMEHLGKRTGGTESIFEMLSPE